MMKKSAKNIMSFPVNIPWRPRTHRFVVDRDVVVVVENVDVVGHEATVVQEGIVVQNVVEEVVDAVGHEAIVVQEGIVVQNVVEEVADAVGHEAIVVQEGIVVQNVVEEVAVVDGDGGGVAVGNEGGGGVQNADRVDGVNGGGGVQNADEGDGANGGGGGIADQGGDANGGGGGIADQGDGANGGDQGDGANGGGGGGVIVGRKRGRSTLRPANVLVHGWVGGKHACVDLTGVSPLVRLGTGDFIVGQAALKAASSKVAKHEKACSDNQHVFIPFAFDTFGFLAPEPVDLLRRVQKIMHSNIVSPRSMNVVFRRIGFAIQKDLAAQLVVRLSFIHV